MPQTFTACSCPPNQLSRPGPQAANRVKSEAVITCKEQKRAPWHKLTVSKQPHNANDAGYCS
jgi:hypothetical protein